MSTDVSIVTKQICKRKPEWARFRLKAPGTIVYSNQPIKVTESGFGFEVDKLHADFLPQEDFQVREVKSRIPIDKNYVTLQVVG